MSYQTITNKLLQLINEGNILMSNLYAYNDSIKANPNIKIEEIVQSLKIEKNKWSKKVKHVLNDDELFLEKEEFSNQIYYASDYCGIHESLTTILDFMRNKNNLLVKIAKNIELKHSREVVILNIDDFDNFKDIKKINPSEVKDFCKDCFLEDDVENTFLEKLEEPYKELDSGSETRDLFSDRIIYKGKRLATVFMFKGRGQKGELTIKKAGSTGNQLLKLAKNNSAECFIVQHTNKINPDTREALQDHILQNTRLSKIYICFIDGVDTARFLKDAGKDLNKLKK